MTLILFILSPQMHSHLQVWQHAVPWIVKNFECATFLSCLHNRRRYCVSNGDGDVKKIFLLPGYVAITVKRCARQFHNAQFAAFKFKRHFAKRCYYVKPNCSGKM